MLAGGLLALMHSASSLALRANIFVTGIATNLLSAGLVAVLSERVFGQRGVVRFPGFPSVPVISAPEWLGPIGKAVLAHNIFVPLGWAAALLVWLVLEKTSFGLRLRGTGYNASVTAAVGVNPRSYQIAGMSLAGLLCGLAGASLSLNLGAIVPGVTAGRGWIALVIVYLGARRVGGIVLAAAFFGLAESISNFTQGFLDLPADLVLAFPFAASFVALVIHSAWENAHKPEIVRREREG
jgi:simple sugar transport system permease protein